MTNYTLSSERGKYDLLVIPVFSDSLVKQIKEFDPALEAHFSKAMQKDFEGKPRQSLLLYGGMEYPRLLLLGMGKKKDFNIRVWKQIVGTGIMSAQGKKAGRVGLTVFASVVKKLGSRKTGETAVVAAEVAQYAFDDYKPKDEKVKEVKNIQFIADLSGADKRNFQKGMEDGQVIADGVNHVRHLGNTPPTIMTPSLLADEAVEMCKGNSKLKSKVLSRPEMKKLGMGCLLGVSSGSAKEPKFIVIEYKNAAKTQKPTVLVGKGITFDSGGLHIKPDAYMTEMKFDMLGAATVLGTIKAVAGLGLKKNIVGIVPTCENMPDGDSYRPDDILTAMNGRTVEIQNTDAEGRVILADGLSYTTMKYEPKEVIDFATLTGACMVAVGEERSGLFSPVDSLAKKLKKASETVGEQLWRLPLGEEFSESIKSVVADVKNIGSTRYGGASTAAAFLQFFTLDPKTGEEKYPWAHIDLSSAHVKGKGNAYIRGGANGFGVETMVEYLR